jgi:hypothetical protein
MSSKRYWNPAMDLDKFGELRKTGWPRHIRAGGQTCPILLTGIWLGNQICPDFLENLVQSSFSSIHTSPTHPMHPT